ncbi:MAG: hypothetical protein WCI50_14195 [Actinomycetes bacterium]
MDLLDQPHELRSPAVISDEVDGEVLAIDLDQGIYYVVPPAAAHVWRALTRGVPARVVAADRTAGEQQAVAAFLAQLVEVGLVRAAPAPIIPDAPVPWDGSPLLLEAHDDMADLLGLDPIHDADDVAGWPTPPPE